MSIQLARKKVLLMSEQENKIIYVAPDNSGKLRRVNSAAEVPSELPKLSCGLDPEVLMSRGFRYLSRSGVINQPTDQLIEGLLDAVYSPGKIVSLRPMNAF
jgi:hypothetical protein